VASFQTNRSILHGAVQASPLLLESRLILSEQEATTKAPANVDRPSSVGGQDVLVVEVCLFECVGEHRGAVTGQDVRGQLSATGRRIGQGGRRCRRSNALKRRKERHGRYGQRAKR